LLEENLSTLLSHYPEQKQTIIDPGIAAGGVFTKADECLPFASIAAGNVLTHRTRKAKRIVWPGSVVMLCGQLPGSAMTTTIAKIHGDAARTENRVAELLGKMTLAEKIGQMNQIHAGDMDPVEMLGDALRAGRIGSIINQVDVATVNELQRIAVEESRLGIPLLVGRDVIHGFKTIMPIPLGQAAARNQASTGPSRR
jgi:hypothetical protein